MNSSKIGELHQQATCYVYVLCLRSILLKLSTVRTSPQSGLVQIKEQFRPYLSDPLPPGHTVLQTHPNTHSPQLQSKPDCTPQRSTWIHWCFTKYTGKRWIPTRSHPLDLHVRTVCVLPPLRAYPPDTQGLHSGGSTCCQRRLWITMRNKSNVGGEMRWELSVAGGVTDFTLQIHSTPPKQIRRWW